MSLQFSAQSLREIETIRKRHETARSCLLPVLFVAQNEFGYLTDEAMELVGDTLGLSIQDVYEVATFYTMYNTKPVGTYHIQVCGNLSCYLNGAFNMVAMLEQELGIRVGETSEDHQFTLTRVECLGSCGTAPVIQVNEDYHENMTPEKLTALLEDLRSKAKQLSPHNGGLS